MNEQLKVSLLTICNNDKFAQYLDQLRDRWSDESEYEDIEDYRKAVETNVAGIVADVKVERMLTRPFGFVGNLNGNRFKLFIKNRGNSFSLCTAGLS